MISLGCYVKNELLIKSKLTLILLVVLELVAFGIKKVTSLGGVNGFGKHDEPSQSEIYVYIGNRSQFANFKSCNGDDCTFTDCCNGYDCVKEPGYKRCRSCKPLEEKCNEKIDICCGHSKYQNYCKYENEGNSQGTCEKCAEEGKSCNPRKKQKDCCQLSVADTNAGFGIACIKNDQTQTSSCTKCRLTGQSCGTNDDCCEFNYSFDGVGCVENETTKEKYCGLFILDVPVDLKSTHMKL